MLLIGSVVSILLGIVISGPLGYHVQLAAAQKESSNSTTMATADTVQFSAKGMLGSYTWVNTNNGASNPTLSFKINTDDIIKIQNPTDTKHQFIIDQNGKQLATSGDIQLVVQVRYRDMNKVVRFGNSWCSSKKFR
jgi:hypothetical protein